MTWEVLSKEKKKNDAVRVMYELELREPPTTHL